MIADTYMTKPRGELTPVNLDLPDFDNSRSFSDFHLAWASLVAWSGDRISTVVGHFSTRTILFLSILHLVMRGRMPVVSFFNERWSLDLN